MLHRHRSTLFPYTTLFRSFKFAVRTLASSLKRTIYQAGLTPDDIDLFIPHQANLRIIETAARQMRVPAEKFRSEEHTSELQSRENLVCRLLLEKKKQLNIL